jgi:hypothetical protein
MTIRVRVSALKGTEAVSGNGSAFIVTDSKAIARVEADSLNNTGGLLVAALTVVGAPLMHIRRTIWATK